MLLRSLIASSGVIAFAATARAGFDFRFLGTLQGTQQPAEVRLTEIRPIDANPDPTIGQYGGAYLESFTWVLLEGSTIVSFRNEPATLWVYDLPDGDRIEFTSRAQYPYPNPVNPRVSGTLRFPPDVLTGDALPQTLDLSRATLAHVEHVGVNTLMYITVAGAVITVPEPAAAAAVAVLAVASVLHRREGRRQRP